MEEAEHKMDVAKARVEASKAKLDKTSKSDIAYAAAKARHKTDEVELEVAEKKHSLAQAKHNEADARLKVADAELGVSQAKLTSSSTLDGSAQKVIGAAESKLLGANEMLMLARSEQGKAAGNLNAAETKLHDAKVQLKKTNNDTSQTLLTQAQANLAAFVKGQPQMSWNQDTSKDFIILEAPSILDSGGHVARFPFSGKGLDYSENEVHKLLLRKSHTGLYHLILTHLFARAVGHVGVEPVFLVRGPPGTGKSVMLNLVWYVAYFELKMNVICHNSSGEIHLYSPGNDVTPLSKKDVKGWLRDKSTVYLFDPDEYFSKPVFHDETQATTVIATSPNVKHYRNVLSSINAIPKFPGILPLWSYGWTEDEIKGGLRLLGKKVTQSVEDVIPAVVGNFRVALQTATHRRVLEHRKDTIFSARQANELLSSAITKMDSDELERLGSVKSANNLTEILFSSNAKDKFQLSHSIVTQMAPEPESEPEPDAPEVDDSVVPQMAPRPNAPELDGIPELIKKFKKVKEEATSTEDLLGEVTEMVQSLAPSLKYHREYSFQWANGHAKELLFETAIERGMVGALRGLFKIVSPSVKGQAFEGTFSHILHPKPYLILDSKGIWTKMTLNLSQAFRSQDDKTDCENVTLFPETGSPPFELIVNTLFTLHGDDEVGKHDFAHLVRRFDPLSKQHTDFDLYVGDYPGGLDKDVRVLLLQITAS